MEIYLSIISFAILIYELFPSEMNTFILELKESFKDNPAKELKYIGMSAFMTICITYAPVLYITQYMRHFGFYSYEIFNINRNMATFSTLNIIFLLVILFFYMTFWIYTLKEKMYLLSLGMILCSLTMIVSLFLSAQSSGNINKIAGILFFSFLIGVYSIIIFFLKPKHKIKVWWVILILSLCIVLSPFCFPYATDTLVGIGLRSMNVGDEKIEIQDEKYNHGQHEYCLLLRTNDFLYLMDTKNKNDIKIISSKSVQLTQHREKERCIN